MNDTALAVFGVAGLVGLAGLLVPLSKRVMLPHTVLLAALGGALGFALVLPLEGTGPVVDFLRALTGIQVSSEVLIYVFLPPLLFSGGLTIDVRRLLDEIAPVLVLAVVAVGLTTVAVGLAVSAAVGHGLIVCLILGAIVATTDTAAVLGVFRDIGVPRRLSIIVEGESLLNDAAAIALFVLLLDMAMQPEAVGVLDGVRLFAVGLLGGIAVGFVAARAVTLLIPLLRGARLTEITLSLTLAYVTFIVADIYLGVSGIIAVVTAAMTFAIDARTKLSPGTWEILRAIWRQLDFWASSLIFVLAAMVAPAALAGATQADMLAISVTFFAAGFARAVILFGLMPLLSLSNLSSPVDRRYKVVLLWGAIRGAVTIALALSLRDHIALAPEESRFILVVAVGFVLATLFVNAPTLRPLMRVLRLDLLDPRERKIRDRVVALSRRRVDERVADLIGAAPGEREAIPEQSLGARDRLEVALAATCAREIELCLAYLRRGQVDREIAETMLFHAQHIAEAIREGGIEGYASAWVSNHQMTWRFQVALWLHRRWRLTGPLAAEIASRFDLLLVKAHLIRDLLAYQPSQIRPLVGADAAQTMEDLLHARERALADAIEALEIQYPDYAKALRARYAERVRLNLEASEYREQRAQSIISDEVFEDLETDLRRRAEALERRPTLELGLRLQEMLRRVPMLAGLDEAHLLQLSNALTPAIAPPGERIIRAGTRGDRMYFITTGRVSVELSPTPVALGPGDFFGEMALLNDAPRNADVVAALYTNLLVLRRTDLHRLMREVPEVRAAIKRIASERELANAGAG
ncbi:MAG: cyclic nucleotide-binding domain-containing protein [Alphaproteobacteria bacterium]|nr:cyclic nucleotide-binding domain-containing protein [Alphaproteobacteria bacterium]